MADGHRSKWLVLKFEVILHGQGMGGLWGRVVFGEGEGRSKSCSDTLTCFQFNVASL